MGKVCGWQEIIEHPIPGRRMKPRHNGLTMVMDKGMGLEQMRDLLEAAGEYIDFLKLGFGTSALYHPEVLHKKITLAQSLGVEIYPGGTLMEVALAQGRMEDYLLRARELGFKVVEISDGTIEISPETRSAIIRRAAALGFKVLTEIGKKGKGTPFHVPVMREQLRKDLFDGAYKVIIEARESGTGVSIFDDAGNIDHLKMQQLLLAVSDEDSLIWEAPLKHQQLEFIKLLGNNVNLGNIPPQEVLAVETLRRGLRSDTLKPALQGNVHPGLNNSLTAP